jgi:hypothetical protein
MLVEVVAGQDKKDYFMQRKRSQGAEPVVEVQCLQTRGTWCKGNMQELMKIWKNMM